MWRRRNITLEGKIIIFKTLTLSKITFLAQASFRNCESDKRHIKTNTKKFFMEFIFPESEL